MRLYLVRHGETEGNRQRRYIGWENPPLTSTGEEQARSLAQALAQHPITAIHSSDLARAMATAGPIAALHHLQVRPDPDLREVNFGAWSSLTYEEIAQTCPDDLRAWIGDPEQFAPPDGESLETLRRRALRALPRQDGALVVSHGGTLRALLAHWTGRAFWEQQVPLACLIVVEWDGEKAREVRDISGTAPV
jgi:alpha-ribazole phosphatase